MTIYVDEIVEFPTNKINQDARKYGNFWCHMATDRNVKELHEFAEKIGLLREWFQDHKRMPHYDIVPSKRKIAIENGAILLNATEVFRRCAIKRVKK